jgi:hypothetical protein
MTFRSTSYDWLVVAGAKATYKGAGTINGSGDYGLMLTAIDGQTAGGGGQDRFRMKIWDRANSDTIVYDNQMGEADDSSAATALGGGSIVVHKSESPAGLTAAAQLRTVSAAATPLGAQIVVALSGPADVDAQVLNLAGRPVRTLCRSRALPGGTTTLLWNAQGDNGLPVPSGTYLISLTASSPSGRVSRALTTIRLSR